MDKTKNFDLIKELASEDFLGFCKDVLLPSLRPLETFRYFIILAITVLISAEIWFIWFFVKNIFFKMFTLGNDPVFESLYEVFSNDQVEARYLLTPSFMTRLAKADLRNKSFRITLSFENGTINMALPSAKDWFEFSLFKSVNDIRNLQTVLLELANILAIVDTLRMEENIGM